MNTAPLAQLHARLAPTAGVDLRLIESTIQSAPITEGWKAVFGSAPLTLAAAVLDPFDPAAGFFVLHGRTDLLGMQGLALELTFFVVHDPAPPVQDIVHCLVRPTNLPPAWTVAQAFPDLPGYINMSADMVAKGRQESFFRDMRFADIALIASSYDFFAAERARLAAPGGAPSISLASVPTLGGELLRAGVNYSANIALDGLFWDTLKAIRPTLNQLDIVGNLQPMTPSQQRDVAGNAAPQKSLSDDAGTTDSEADADADEDEPDTELVLRVGHRFTDATLDFGAGVGASLRQLVVQTGLTPGSDVGPGMYLVLGAGTDALTFDLTLDLSIGGSTFLLSGDFDDGKLITLDQVEKAFGLDALAQLVPDLDALGELGLRSVRAAVSLSPPKLQELTIQIATELPWEMIEDLVWVEPVLVFRRTEDRGTELRIAGDWQVGATLFDIYVDTGTGAAGASLAIGEVLEVDEMFAELFPGAEIPDIEIRELELTGNYKTTLVAFAMEAASNWTFEVGGKPFGIRDIIIRAAYQGPSAAEGAPGFTGSLIGVLEVAGWMMTVDVEIATQLSVEATIPDLPVSDLVDEFLQLVHLPYQMPDFHLTDVDLRVVPKTGDFRISGGSADAIEIVHGFGFTLSHFDVSRDAQHDQAARLGLVLALGAVKAECVADYHVSAAEKPAEGAVPAKEWLFTVKLPGQAIPVGHLLVALQRMAGLEYPLPIDGISLHDFYVSFNLGIEQRFFVLAASVFDGDKEWGKLSLVARMSDPAPPKTATKPGWEWAFSAQVNLDIGLDGLPLVGPQLTSVAPVRLHGVQLTDASRDFTRADVDALIALLPQEAVRPPSQAIGTGLTFQALFQAADSDLVMAVPIKTSAAKSAKSPDGKTPADEKQAGTPSPSLMPPDPVTQFQPPAPTDQTKWFPVHKSIQAVTLSRVGLRYVNSELLLLVDASLQVGAFELELLGLGAGSPLAHFAPAFNLDGFSLSYDTPALEISGGFLRTETGSYVGSAQLKTAAINLSILGQYGSADGHPSMFLFGLLGTAPGGPPYFFVKGLAVAIGYNSRLDPPSIAALPTFSLVQAVLPSKSSGQPAVGQRPISPGDDPGTVLRLMGRDVQPAYGEQWIGAGVRFSTFEQMQSFALATVAFGQKLEVGLLGVSQLTVPALAPSPIAYAELMLRAVFDPAAGVMAIDAKIAPNSYVLSNQARLTGGFAFRVWFGGEYKDDFVVTLGGYHPHFAVPAHYPRPNRLQLVWQISDEMSVKGTLYFALTSRAVMAGGSLEAVWQSGDLRAWYSVEADFLLYWKPFHYEADLDISLGISLRINLLFTTATITLHVGVGLSLYGPEFGGEARIDLSIVSFTIHFGSSPAPLDPIKWTEFKSTFLPPPAPPTGMRAVAPVPTNAIRTTTVVSIQLAAGMVRDLARDLTYTGDLDWVVNAEQLVMSAASTIPAKTALLNKRPLSAAAGRSWASKIGIVPCAIADTTLETSLQLTLTRRDSTGAEDPFEGFTLTPVLRNVPGLLWAYTGNRRPGLSDLSVLADALVGFQIVPMRTVIDITADIELAKLLYELLSDPKPFAWPPTPVAPTNTFAREISSDGGSLTMKVGGADVIDRNFVLGSLLGSAAAARRTAAVNAMRVRGLPVTGRIELTRMGTDTELDDWPTVRPLGAAA